MRSYDCEVCVRVRYVCLVYKKNGPRHSTLLPQYAAAGHMEHRAPRNTLNNQCHGVSEESASKLISCGAGGKNKERGKRVVQLHRKIQRSAPCVKKLFSVVFTVRSKKEIFQGKDFLRDLDG